jgi:hypothetical protein
MKPLLERLNAQLDLYTARSGSSWQHLPGSLLPESAHDLEIADLLILAWNLRAAPQLHVNPRFARHMEGRLLRYDAEVRKRQKEQTTQVHLLKRWLMFIHKSRQRE